MAAADASGIASLRLEFLPQEFNFGPSVVTGACENNAWPYNGYVMDHYEYRRYQTGATPFFPPFRFPGQYHDTDTDFFENWNRYYDPQTGRYLQPEPLLQSPYYAARLARRGMSAPTYAYAANNPMHFTDPDGLKIVVNWGSDGQTVTNMANAIGNLRSTPAGRALYDRLDARPEIITVSHQPTYLDLRKGRQRLIHGETSKTNSCQVDTTPTDEKWRDPAVILGHELRHAEQNLDNPGRSRRDHEVSSQVTDMFIQLQLP